MTLWRKSFSSIDEAVLFIRINIAFVRLKHGELSIGFGEAFADGSESWYVVCTRQGVNQ